MGVLVIRKTSIFVSTRRRQPSSYSRTLRAGWGLPPARTRRVSSIGAGLAPLSAPLIVSEPAVTSSAWPPPSSDALDETHAKSILKISNHFTHAWRR